jgi:hypothetical protein
MKQHRRIGGYARLACALASAATLLAAPACGDDGSDTPPVAGDVGGSILFVTQVPVGGFGSATATFSNHLPTMRTTPRGGSLMLRLPDGTLRNLTREAGYGMEGFQGADAIAVREPAVHWDGKKALFSMVIGAPTEQFQGGRYVWQIYEVTGLGKGETASIRKIENQPDYNNVSPIYGTDDRIIFASDRPRGGEPHLYPQLDEYESDDTTVGIFSLDENTGDLALLEHSPSGVFNLSIDSFGRVIFTKWDHLQRDQQADEPGHVGTYKPFTWASEAADAARTTTLTGQETFPEARTEEDPDYDAQFEGHTFNHFFPWEMNEDGSAEETLNHIGRQELGGSFSEGSFKDDPNLTFYKPEPYQANQHRITGRGGIFQMREDPRTPGRFFAIIAPEFSTGSAGTIVAMNGAPTDNPEDMAMTAITPTESQGGVPEDTGYFRNPLPLANGTLVAVHTDASGYLDNEGSEASPRWNYEFRLRVMSKSGEFYQPGATLTPGIPAEVTWWTPDVMASWSGTLWELDPVEVKATPRPARRAPVIEPPEAAVFSEVGVDPAVFQDWLAERNLALIVSRNVTQRDRADRQQPYNLRVPGGVESIGEPGTVYDITHLQVFQGDQLRGYGDVDDPPPGRRILPRPMHEAGVGPTPVGAPDGSVVLGTDGSFAALVPARRALTWQLTGPGGAPVVRERNWVSFAPGEVRVCAACHGINKQSQTGDGIPMNEPEALRALLEQWLADNP